MQIVPLSTTDTCAIDQYDSRSLFATSRVMYNYCK